MMHGSADIKIVEVSFPPEFPDVKNVFFKPITVHWAIRYDIKTNQYM